MRQHSDNCASKSTEITICTCGLAEEIVSNARFVKALGIAELSDLAESDIPHLLDLLVAADQLAQAAEQLMPNIYDDGCEGETGFERKVIQLRDCLVAYRKAREGK
jgi:hypothetical protein